MPSSSNRKSSSSGSNKKPVFRRADGSIKPVSARPGKREKAQSSLASAQKQAPSARTYSVPVRNRPHTGKNKPLARPEQGRSTLKTPGSTSLRTGGATPSSKSLSVPRKLSQQSSPTSRTKPGSSTKNTPHSLATRSDAVLSKSARTPSASRHRQASPTTSRARREVPLEGFKRVLNTTPLARKTASEQASSPVHRRIKIAVISAVSVVVLVLAVIGVLVNSSVFAATDIQFKGSEHVSVELMKRLVSIPQNTTLFTINEKQITASLQQSPWVKSVHIERQFPHTLIIRPEERKVVAVAYLAADNIAWAIGSDGSWIAPLSVDALSTQQESGSSQTDQSNGSSAQDGAQTVSTDSSDSSAGQSSAESQSSQESEDASTTSTPESASADGAEAASGTQAALKLAQQLGAVLLIDVPTDVNPQSGQPVTSASITCALSYIQGFSSEFLSTIKDFSVGSQDAVSADLKSGVEVSLGPATDIQTKEEVVRKLLEKEDHVTYINVRTPDAYSFRRATL